jgi:hypothetical protein
MDMGCKPDYDSDDMSMGLDPEGLGDNLDSKVDTFHCDFDSASRMMDCDSAKVETLKIVLLYRIPARVL